MNRRNFIGGLLAATAGFMVLPGAARKWVKSNGIIRCEYSAFLVDQIPRFDELIMQEIRPEDSWVGQVETATFDYVPGRALFVQKMVEYNFKLNLPYPD